MSIVRIAILAAAFTAALAVPLGARAQVEGPTQAVRLCDNLTLYASGHDGAGLWSGVRVEDSRTATPVTYTAATAQEGELRGAPGLLLENGQLQMAGAGGQSVTLTFQEYVIASCADAVLHGPS
jgi:hypothetical protein